MAGKTFSTVRGFRDLLADDCRRLCALEEAARATFELYGFREIRLPTLEHRELFIKSTGETSDIVEKEMFEFTDPGGRALAMRPEGTPGVARAYIGNHLDQQGHAAKFFYIGSMFRYERPQAGRFREHEQIGVESIGNPHPAADAEAILALKHLLDMIGLVGKTRLRLNNIGCDENPGCRPAYREALKAYLKKREDGLCENCRRRMDRNPLRCLDCKKDGPGLAGGAPELKPCAKCFEHVETVARLLAENGSGPLVYPDKNLVRGLDYYTSTVFEFQYCKEDDRAPYSGDPAAPRSTARKENDRAPAAALGSQDALAGGGRYDALIASMGGKPAPAVGWAMGADRVLMAARAADPDVSALEKIRPRPRTEVFVASATKDAATLDKSVEVLESLRRFGIPSAGGFFSLSLKAQMREASRLGARFTAVLGEDELKKDPPACMLKDMDAGSQEEVPLTGLLERIGDLLKPEVAALGKEA